MIPFAVVMIPQYVLFTKLGWTNSLLPLIIPGLFGNVSMIFFLRQNLYSIPTELMEAAKLDGCSYFGTYWRIFLRSESNWTLPVVTIGAALAAMYAVNLRSVRYGDGYVVQTYFKAFKESFVQATIAWLIVAAASLLIFFDIRLWSVMGGGFVQKAMLAVSYALAGILFVLFTWLFPVIAKMKDSLKNQFANAAKMAVGYFVPYTLLCLLIQGAAGLPYAPVWKIIHPGAVRTGLSFCWTG